MQLGLNIGIPKLLPTSAVVSNWRPTPVNQLPAWTGARRVCLDVETRDDQLKELGPGVRRGGYIVGFGFAIEDGPSHYVPYRHDGGDNVDPAHAIDYLRTQLRSYTGEICGAGFSYDLDYIMEECGDDCVPYVKGYRDCLIAEPILDQLQNTYGLDAVAARYLIPGKDETVMRNAIKAYGIDEGEVKKHLWRLPARYVGAYVKQDTRLPLQLLDRQERKIIDWDLWKIWELESKVLPVLVKMRRRGIRVNMQKLSAIEQWTIKVVAECLDKVYSLTGVRMHPADITKSAMIAKAVEAAGYKLPRTAPTGKHREGQPSTKNMYLAKCGEVGAAFRRAKEFTKLRTTFCHQIRKYEVKGRIHATIKQLKGAKDGETGGDDDDEEKGAKWGRCSSTDPNMQYQPTRNDEYGHVWRDIYEPDGDDEWVCSDWSQQEPRWAVHYAELLRLPGAKEFADMYRKNPALDIHQMLTDIVNDPENLPRKIVKNFMNGRIYGMGDFKLCLSCNWETIPHVNKKGESIRIPGPEAAIKIKRFDDEVPWVRLLVREAAKVAEKRGYVLTAYGRRCNFPPRADGKFDWAHKAFSRIGQGSAADQAKLAMVECDRAGVPLQLAVHDEFDWSGLKWAKIVKEIQLTCLPCNVPHMVDTEAGPSWGRLKKVYV